jgi:hypothetical protein
MESVSRHGRGKPLGHYEHDLIGLEDVGAKKGLGYTAV